MDGVLDRWINGMREKKGKWGQRDNETMDGWMDG